MFCIVFAYFVHSPAFKTRRVDVIVSWAAVSAVFCLVGCNCYLCHIYVAYKRFNMPLRIKWWWWWWCRLVMLN